MGRPIPRPSWAVKAAQPAAPSSGASHRSSQVQPYLSEVHGTAGAGSRPSSDAASASRAHSCS